MTMYSIVEMQHLDAIIFLVLDKNICGHDT